MHNTLTTSRATAQELTNAFLRSVYNWMAVGLALTAGAALLTVQSGFVNYLFSQSGTMLLIGLIVLQLGIVFYMSARVAKLGTQAITGLFLVYSTLTGITLSSILIVYTASSVAGAFISTAGMFAAVSVYGLVTKRDLSGVGSFCFMGLIGLIIAMVVNMFLQSGPFGLLISFAGVIIFVGLTAYDTQKLKVMGEALPHDDPVAVRRGTIMGALTLYLDFINMFIMMVRILGDRR